MSDSFFFPKGFAPFSRAHRRSASGYPNVERDKKDTIVGNERELQRAIAERYDDGGGVIKLGNTIPLSAPIRLFGRGRGTIIDGNHFEILAASQTGNIFEVSGSNGGAYGITIRNLHAYHESDETDDLVWSGSLIYVKDGGNLSNVHIVDNFLQYLNGSDPKLIGYETTSDLFQASVVARNIFDAMDINIQGDNNVVIGNMGDPLDITIVAPASGDYTNNVVSGNVLGGGTIDTSAGLRSTVYGNTGYTSITIDATDKPTPAADHNTSLT